MKTQHGKLSPKEESFVEKYEAPSYKEIEARIKYIQGKVLTVIEASISDVGQRKAVKDLVKHIFSEQLTSLYNVTHPNSVMLSEADMVQIGEGSLEAFYENNVDIAS